MEVFTYLLETYILHFAFTPGLPLAISANTKYEYECFYLAYFLNFMPH